MENLSVGQLGAMNVEAVLEVARRLGLSYDLDELLDLIVSDTCAVLGCERATLFLHDPARRELVSKIALGVREIRISIDQGIAGACARTGTTINIPDAYADPRFNPDVDKKTGYTTRNILTCPLVGLNHQLVGVLQAINKRAGVFSGLDERLLETLSSQAAVAIQRAHLLKEQAEKHRLEHELNLAKEIQSALLPKSAPQPAGYDIAGWNKPAEQTGGDCYDFLTTADPNVLGILLADASGHGIAPALIVSQLRAVLRALSGLDLGLSEMMARANAILCRDLPVGRFVTTFFGMLSTDRNELVYCSAGHGPILHVKPKSKTVKIFGGNACPLGIMPGMQFPAAPIIQIGPGDLVLIITDGFVEWRNPAEELYGNKRLKTFILNHAKLPAADLIARLREDVERFCKGTPQEDDLTAVVIRRSQKSEFRSQKKRRS